MLEKITLLYILFSRHSSTIAIMTEMTYIRDRHRETLSLRRQKEDMRDMAIFHATRRLRYLHTRAFARFSILRRAAVRRYATRRVLFAHILSLRVDATQQHVAIYAMMSLIWCPQLRAFLLCARAQRKRLRAMFCASHTPRYSALMIIYFLHRLSRDICHYFFFSRHASPRYASCYLTAYDICLYARGEGLLAIFRLSRYELLMRANTVLCDADAAHCRHGDVPVIEYFSHRLIFRLPLPPAPIYAPPAEWRPTRVTRTPRRRERVIIFSSWWYFPAPRRCLASLFFLHDAALSTICRVSYAAPFAALAIIARIEAICRAMPYFIVFSSAFIAAWARHDMPYDADNAICRAARYAIRRCAFDYSLCLTFLRRFFFLRCCFACSPSIFTDVTISCLLPCYGPMMLIMLCRPFFFACW